MRTAVRIAACDTAVVPSVATLRQTAVARLADYVLLMKPRISLLVLLCVSAGFALGSTDAWRPLLLANALLGIALVATASSAFNQWLERDSDALMLRTQNRPLPSRRLSPAEVLMFGLVTGILGIVWLAAFVDSVTAVLATMTLVLYVGVYTPLKRRTSFGTAVGAIPGAMPPVLGWAAAGAPLDAGAFSLFALLFLWQFPHFLAIAWIYRDQYAQAGLKMLPARGQMPRVTGIMAVGYAAVLVPLSLFPAACGLAGNVYLVVALVLSAAYLAAAARFATRESTESARGLLWMSLIYLPTLLLTLVWDHFSLLT